VNLAAEILVLHLRDEFTAEVVVDRDRSRRFER
jgi:hypothetical protein